MLSRYTIRSLNIDKDVDKIFHVINNPNEQLNLIGHINSNTIDIYKKQLAVKLVVVFRLVCLRL